MQEIMSVLANPYAPEWAKQYALSLLQRRQQAGLPGEWKEKARYDPQTGQWLPGFVNPYTGAVTIPEGTAGAAPGGDGQAAAGGTAPDLLGDDQKNAWINIGKQPSLSPAAIGTELTGGRRTGETIPDYNKRVSDEISKTRAALADEIKTDPGRAVLLNGTPVYNAMIADARRTDAASALALRAGLTQIIRPGQRSPLSPDDIRAAFEGIGVPAKILEEVLAFFGTQGHAPLSAKAKLAMLDAARGRLDSSQETYGETVLDAQSRAHRYGLDVTEFAPRPPRIHDFDRDDIKDSLAEEEGEKPPPKKLPTFNREKGRVE
jgi:hypothetical protein